MVAELGLADALVLRSAAADNDDGAAHSRLGVVAAHYAAGQVGDHDMIGVGSGRGVWHCINELDGQERLKKLQGLKVVSLAGALAQWGPLARLDADANADQLARTLNLPSTAIRTTNLPLSMFELGPKQRRSVVDEIAPQLAEGTWESDDPPWNHAPGVLILGLGILAPGHSLEGSAGVPPRGIEEHMAELRRDYLDAKSVADVGFNLIPLRDLRLSRGPRPELLDLLTRINALTFKVSLEKLNAARVRVLIAGGPKSK